MTLWLLFECHLRERWRIDWTKHLVLKLIVAHDAYHGGVVGGIAKFRNIDGPTIAFLGIIERVAQSIVSTHATSHRHVIDACLLNSLLQLLHQDINDSPLQRGSNVLLVLLYEVGVFSYPLL